MLDPQTQSSNLEEYITGREIIQTALDLSFASIPGGKGAEINYQSHLTPSFSRGMKANTVPITAKIELTMIKTQSKIRSRLLILF